MAIEERGAFGMSHDVAKGELADWAGRHVVGFGSHRVELAHAIVTAPERLPVAGPKPVEPAAVNRQVRKGHVADRTAGGREEGYPAVDVVKQAVGDLDIADTRMVAFTEFDPRGGRGEAAIGDTNAIAGQGGSPG